MDVRRTRRVGSRTSSSGSSDNRISPGQEHGSRDDLPANVRLCGHVDEAEKTRLLSEAWVVINTSIHEGMPVSLLEALACETPFLSGVNPGYAIAQFGIITGRTDGDGMQGLEALRHGLDRLLGDDASAPRDGPARS